MRTGVRDNNAPAQPVLTRDDLAPIPPRYWWLKRLLLLVVLLLVALGGLHWYWGVEADRRWRAAVAALEATGDPLYAKDFATSPVPDEENAAHYLQLAADALVTHPQDTAFHDLVPDLVAGRNTAEVADLLERNAEALRLVHVASTHPRAWWQVDVSRGLLSAKWPDLPRQAEVGHLVNLAAVYDCVNGDDPRAMSRIQDLLSQSAAVNRSRSLLGHLLALLISADAAASIEVVAPDLRVIPKKDGDKRVSVDQVRAVIRDLLDEDELQRGWHDAFCAERAVQFEGINRVTLGGLAAAGLKFSWVDRVLWSLYGPALELDGVKLLDQATGYVRAAGASNLPAAERALPAEPAFHTKLERMTRLLGGLLAPSFGSTYRGRFRQIGARRLAAARLAIRLYELDRGAPPASPAELVPDYVPGIPEDPLFDDHRPIGYEPHGADVGLFIGAPQVDAGSRGKQSSTPTTGLARYPVSMRMDGGRNTVSTEPSASTQAVEHRHDMESQHGQANLDQQPDKSP